jgi:prevent-host-death family protein
MTIVGVRELKQNASAVVREAVEGGPVVISDRGRPVAQLVRLPESRYQRLVDAGLLRPARRSVAELPAPEALDGPSPAELLAEMRDDERY